MTFLKKYEQDRASVKLSGTVLVEAVSNATGYKLTQMEVVALVHIRRLGLKKKQATCSRLAEKLKVTLPQVTTLNNSLVKQGLTKHSVPAPKPDRRQRLLATTKKGAEVAAVVEGL